MSDPLPTVAHWRPASEPPECPVGEEVEALIMITVDVVGGPTRGRQACGPILARYGDGVFTVAYGDRVTPVHAIHWAPLPAPPESLS